MEQVPHWLMATVFAAGMTAYAEEVDGAGEEMAPSDRDTGDSAGHAADAPDAIH